MNTTAPTRVWAWMMKMENGMRLAKISIVGHLGRDAESRFTPAGKAVTEFSVAVSHSKPDGHGGWDEATDWFRVSVWGEAAKTAAEKYRKGSKVLVEGRLTPDRLLLSGHVYDTAATFAKLFQQLVATDVVTRLLDRREGRGKV